MFSRRLNFIHNWIAQFAGFEFLRLKELFVRIYDQVKVSNHSRYVYMMKNI